MKKLFSILLLAVSIQSFAQYPYKKSQIIDLDAYGRKKGTEYGTVFTFTGFSNTDTLTNIAGVTPTVLNSKILFGDGSSSGSVAEFKWVTSADYWTKVDAFIVGEVDGDSYGFQQRLNSENTTSQLDFFAYLEHRSTPPQDGALSYHLFDGSTDTVIAQSLVNMTISQGDSIWMETKRQGNYFFTTVRNVTTGQVTFCSYRFTGETSAPNTGRPAIAATGLDSLYFSSFALNESVGADLLFLGDSKWTWYGTTYNESEPNLYYYNTDANIVNHGKSGDKTNETVLSLPESAALKARQAIWNIGNDLRQVISDATWQANIDTVYNTLTRAGTDVFFTLMYETDVDQTPYITYLQSKYPTKLILNGYYATRDCSTCLMPDSIHLNAYGKKRHAEADLNAGYLDFNNNFRVIKLTVDSTLEGDSILTNRYYDQTREIKVIRNYHVLSPSDSFEAITYKRTNDSLIFQDDPFVLGEKIIVESSAKTMWTVIPPNPATFKYLLDIVTTAKRAYSVRKLRSAYSGYCMKVRRSSDNTEQDIGFVNNELDTAALKIFVGANSAYVTKWYNQANNDFSGDAVQATSGNQPRIVNAGVIERYQTDNGNWIIGVKGDGSDDNLGFNDVSVTSGEVWSTFMVQKRTSTGVTSGAFGSDACCMISPYYNTSDVLSIFSNGGGHAWNNTASDATATTVLLSGFQTSTTSTPSTSIYKNGSAVTLGGDTDLGFFGNGIFNRLFQATNAAWSNAYISEAIIYQLDKTSNRATIETNINTFYSIY